VAAFTSLRHAHLQARSVHHSDGRN